MLIFEPNPCWLIKKDRGCSKKFHRHSSAGWWWHGLVDGGGGASQWQLINSIKSAEGGTNTNTKGGLVRGWGTFFSWLKKQWQTFIKTPGIVTICLACCRDPHNAIHELHTSHNQNPGQQFYTSPTTLVQNDHHLYQYHRFSSILSCVFDDERVCGEISDLVDSPVSWKHLQVGRARSTHYGYKCCR